MEIAQADAAGFRLLARRNDSLGTQGRRLFFSSMLVVSLGIALVWWFRGVHFVLPFAVIEMAVLYLALRVLDRHSGDFEVITVVEDRLTLERRERGRTSRHEFNTCWARLVVTNGPGQRCGLSLRSHGREVEFGGYLTDEQRLAVASELRKRLKNY